MLLDEEDGMKKKRMYGGWGGRRHTHALDAILLLINFRGEKTETQSGPLGTGRAQTCIRIPLLSPPHHRVLVN